MTFCPYCPYIKSSGLYFPVFEMNTKKYGPEKIAYLYTFCAVVIFDLFDLLYFANGFLRLVIPNDKRHLQVIVGDFVYNVHYCIFKLKNVFFIHINIIGLVTLV